MSYSISKTTITLTRGDSFLAGITLTNADGSNYTPAEGDKIRFAMKSNYSDEKPCLVIDIPIDTMALVIKPEDTKHLDFGTYVYDIQLTRATGEVDTFITKATLKLTEEVD